MDGPSLSHAALLIGAGLVAGVINTHAGGGSLLTVPLLVLLGLPGNLANGTNRVGILLQCLIAARRFRAAGVLDGPSVLRVAAPVALGAVVGALAVGWVADSTFERVFGVLMLVLLVPTLRRMESRAGEPGSAAWPRGLESLLYAGVGLYAGAFQAGVGIPLLFALIHTGHDAVAANALKVAVIAVATLVALPVFAVQGQVAWVPALLLGAGYGAGGALGAHWALRGGERVIRPMLGVAVAILAARMLGLF